MKRCIIISIAALAVASCGASVDENAITFWQDHVCARVLIPEVDNHAGWDFCVERVVATEGMLEYHVRWNGFGLFLTNVDKLSDDGNENMYVVDDRGNRYDHVETRGAALEDTRLDDDFPSAPGVFVFPAAIEGATSFTFHDDDQGVTAGPIVLDASTSTDRRGSLEHLGSVLEALSISIESSWAGLGNPVDDDFTLVRTGSGFELQDSGSGIPEDAVAAFLAELATAPILERDYVPTITHTDDYPFVGIEVKTGAGPIQFGSSSQGRGMVPWKVAVGGETFVIPDDTPARALKRLEAHLPGFQISARDERPRYGGELTSTGDTALVEAARAGNADRVRELIAQGSDVHERSPYDGSTPIGATSDEETIDSLARAGADLEALSAYGSTPLADAAAAGSTGTVAALLKAGANPDTRSGRLGQTAMMLAAENGHIDTVRLLVDEGASVSIRSSYGGTALMRAVKNNYPDIVAVLVGAGSDVNAVAEQSGTALMQASRPEIVNMLVEAGADVNATDQVGRTALMRVVMGGTMFKHTGLSSRDMAPADLAGTVRALLEAGADPDATDDDGRTALIWAAQRRGVEPARALVEAGVDVNQEGDDGRTALFYAAASHSVYGHAHVENVELIRYLLSKGADPLHQDASGQTVMGLVVQDRQRRAIEVLHETRPDAAARDLARAAQAGDVLGVMSRLRSGATPDASALVAAVEGGHRNVVEVLVRAGAHADVAGSNGSPILITAVRNGDAEIVQFLLEAHADPEATTPDGRTAFELAMESNERHIAGLLKEAGAEGEMPIQGGFALCGENTPDGLVIVPCPDPLEELIGSGAAPQPEDRPRPRP